MPDNRGPDLPKAPFVYRPDEAFVGEGPLLRTRRRRVMTALAVVALVLLVVWVLAVLG